MNNAVIEVFFDAQEGIAEKNKIVEEKHVLMQELATAEEKKENSLWDLTEKTIQHFNHLPYIYRNLNPVAKRRIINFLFLNLQLDGKRLRVQAVPEFEKLKNANYRLQGEKLRLNYKLNVEYPHKKALPMIENALLCSNSQYGGLGGT